MSTIGDKHFRLFLSYGRSDAEDIALRLHSDLEAAGYHVWLDQSKIKAGRAWEQQILEGLRSTQLVIALLSPHAVRMQRDGADIDGVCLDEISYARFAHPKRVIPAMVVPCEPPFCLFRLHYVDLCRCRESEDVYQAKLNELLSLIPDALSNRFVYRSWDSALNPLDFSSFLHSRREGFVAREWLIDEIYDWLDSGNLHRALLVIGDPGIGKSALVAQLCHQNRDQRIIAHYCCRHNMLETLRPARFVATLAAMIAEQLPHYGEMLADESIKRALSDDRLRSDPGSAFVEGITTPLHRIPTPEKSPRSILVDALDESLLHQPIAGEHAATIVSLLVDRLEDLPDWLRIVATTRRKTEVLRELERLSKTYLSAHDRRNSNDVAFYLDQRLASPRLQAFLGHERERVSSTLLEGCEGNFLYLRYALDALESGETTVDELDRLPPGLGGLYRQAFNRQFRRAPFEHAATILALIMAARTPLSRAMIESVSAYSGPALGRTMNHLSPVLSMRGDTISLFHRSIEDWLADPERNEEYYVDPREGDRLLADHGWSCYQDSVHGLGDYHLAHLPSHLVSAGRWDDLGTILSDLSYLEARVADGQVFELAADFDGAVAAMSTVGEAPELVAVLNLIAAGLRQDIHWVHDRRDDYPQALFQQLWNYCAWYDTPEAAAYYDEPDCGWSAANAPWLCDGPRLSNVIKRIRAEREARDPGFVWLRALRPPPTTLGSRMLAVIRGHEGPVSSVSLSTDGRLVVSGSYDGTVRIWDGYTGRSVGLLTSQSRVHGISISNDRRLIACACEAKDISVLNRSGQTRQLLPGHEGSVNAVEFLPNNLLISGSSDGSARLWDVQAGCCLRTLDQQPAAILAVAASADGKWIASGGVDRVLTVASETSTEQIVQFPRGTGAIRTLGLTKDGSRIAVGLESSQIQVWDRAQRQCLATLSGHDDAVNSLSLSSDGKRVTSGSADGTIRQWDVELQTETARLRGHESVVTSIACADDHDRIVSGSWDQTIRTWHPRQGYDLQLKGNHSARISTIAISADERFVATGSEDATVRLWSMISGLHLRTWEGHTDWITCLEFTDDGSTVVSGSNDSSLRVWETEGGGRCRLTLMGHRYSVYCVAVSSAASRIVSGSLDKTVRVWDLRTGRAVGVLEGHRHPIDRVAISSDLQTIWSRDSRGNSKAWNLGNLKPMDPSDTVMRTASKLRWQHLKRLWPNQNLEIAQSGSRAVARSGSSITICVVEQGGFRSSAADGQTLVASALPRNLDNQTGSHPIGPVALWDEHWRTQRESTRNELIEHYHYLVEHIVRRIKARLPEFIDADDLVSAGVFGLMDAIDAFDLDRGINFQTFCAPRIRGAILDELRSMDWVPRLVRSRASRSEQARQTLEMQLGRPPKGNELAERLGVSEDEYPQIRWHASVVRVIPLFSSWSSERASGEISERDKDAIEQLEDHHATWRLRQIDNSEIWSVIKPLLSEIQYLVVVLHYVEELTAREIGFSLDLSESRVKRIYQSSLKRLREGLPFDWVDRK